ncbi:MAG: VIT1/CCC1 transporter family protein [Candidatus Omnitrophica bacterium]|nr:VIT1/CCC1 transporter family protein [Candidatus Omnitrophota bacterium]
MMEEKIRAAVLKAQKNEITEHIIYSRLSAMLKNKTHAGILRKIAADELRHYEFWKGLTGADVGPDRMKVFFFILIARVLGLTFSFKLMESGEDLAQDVYENIKALSPRVEAIISEENGHENELVNMIDEERLKYVSSIVLGLNDAMVELTGALVGFTLALSNARLVGIVGLITGIAASLSMAASEYLSTRHEDTKKDPLKASFTTGMAYVLTVAVLVTPFLVFNNAYVCLGIALLSGICIILFFTFYVSVAMGLDFRKRFVEMLTISLSVAAVNFVIGLAIRKIFRIDI